MTTPERWYHYTCDHAAPLIDREGFVRPMTVWRKIDAILAANGEPLTGLWRAPAVVWVTDQPTPNRRALGLTSFTLSCDRTEFRYTVEGDAEAWMAFAARHAATSEYLASLQRRGGDPSRWFVATTPLRVVDRIDRRRRTA